MRYLTVKNWEDHQHYRDRCPPWIKLHRGVLDDYEMSCLQDASKLHLILIWLLSSQLNNRIPDDADWVGKKIGAKSKVNLKELIDKGFLMPEHVDSAMLASCYPEREAYREETEEEKNNKKENPLRETFERFWKVFPTARRGDKEKSFAAYQSAINRTNATPEEIHNGVLAYADSSEAKTHPKGCAAWLSDARWTVSYGQIESANHKSASEIEAEDSYLKNLLTLVKQGSSERIDKQGFEYIEHKLGKDWRQHVA